MDASVIRLSLLLWACACATGCRPLAAYERETLATSRMNLDGDPDEAALERSRLRTREEGHVSGGLGAASGGGGGCGCN